MTKPELGTKRICAGCNAKFYDLHKTTIVCPKCEAVFVVPKPAPERPRRGFESRPLPVRVVAAPKSVPTSVPTSEDAPATGDNADGEKEADAGVPLLEEMDED